MNFWAMGGYARFVWPCFGLAGLVLAWNVWSARRLHAAARVHIARCVQVPTFDVRIKIFIFFIFFIIFIFHYAHDFIG